MCSVLAFTDHPSPARGPLVLPLYTRKPIAGRTTCVSLVDSQCPLRAF